MEENVEKSEKKWNIPIPGPGRPKGVKNSIEKKAIKEYIKDFKESLAPILEIIPPKLREKAEKGDLQAIKEVIDILVDKAPKKSQVGNDPDNPLQPLLVQFIDKPTKDE